jgi:hypothetical protein
MKRPAYLAAVLVAAVIAVAIASAFGHWPEAHFCLGCANSTLLTVALMCGAAKLINRTRRAVRQATLGNK